MASIDLKDPDDARRFVVQGLWLQGVVRPSAETVRSALTWAMPLAADGLPLLPVGVIADLGHAAFGFDRSPRSAATVPGWPAPLARGYEDHVLGKVYADWSFERATDGLRQYSPADRPNGLAFVVDRIRDRLGLPGVEVSPAVLRGLLAVQPESLLDEGYESIARDGLMPLLLSQYVELIAVGRRAAELLGPEDVTAVEHRTALAELGEYVAHRQILLAADRIAAHFPARPVRPLAGRKEVPTRVTDEDVYPVGGYASIANKGSIESLLHSQLALMEPDDRPDLFDVRFVRDELLYYARDENEFLRRRRAFAVAFDPGLTAARFKDPDLPHQRIVLVQAVVVAVVRTLSAWLSTDALRFELLFPTVDGKNPLAREAALFAVLFREPVTRDEVVIRAVESAEDRIKNLAHEYQTHAVWIGPADREIAADRASVSHLIVAGSIPELIDGHGEVCPLESETAADSWAEAALTLLRLWV